MSEGLSERLVRTRGLAGLSARELSSLAELSPSMVTHLENGRIERPGASTIMQIAAVLGTTMEYLLTGGGVPPTEADVRAAVDRARAEHVRESGPGQAEPNGDAA